MNRPHRPAPTGPKPQPVPFPVLSDRALVGAFAALVAARPLVAGDDPGRLRLTSSGGPVSFTLCLFLVLIGFAVWRVAFARGRPARWPIVPLLLAAVGFAAFASSRLGDRYARPGLFVGWEWVGLAAAAYLARRLTASAGDSRGLINLVVASAVSVGGLAVYQAAADRLGLPGTEPVVPVENAPLAGDDEFYPELNGPVEPAKQPHGTFDSPETLLVHLLLVLPVAVTYAKFRRASAWGRWAIVVAPVPLAAAAAAPLSNPFGARGGSWESAIHMAVGHPALGVGPGNFSRLAPDVFTPTRRLARPGGDDRVGRPRPVGGRPGRRALGGPDRPPSPIRGTHRPPGRGGSSTRAGWSGSCSGSSGPSGRCRPRPRPPRCSASGPRPSPGPALWFASFALLETIRPPRAALGRAVLVGAGLVLFYGLVSDAPGRPTILFPLFVLLGLAANLRKPDVPDLPDGGWTKPVRVVRVIAAAGLAVAHLVTAGLPAWGTADAVRRVADGQPPVPGPAPADRAGPAGPGAGNGPDERRRVPAPEHPHPAAGGGRARPRQRGPVAGTGPVAAAPVGVPARRRPGRRGAGGRGDPPGRRPGRPARPEQSGRPAEPVRGRWRCSARTRLPGRPSGSPSSTGGSS